MLKIIRYHFTLIPTHPLFWYTTLYILGIILGSYNLLVGIGTGVLIIITILLFMGSTFSSLPILLFSTLALCSGFYNFQTAQTNHALLSEELVQGPFDLHATVIENELSPKSRVRQKLTLKTIACTQQQKKLSQQPLMQVYLFRSIPVKVGDEINVCNLVYKRTKNKAYQDYLAKEGITATLFLPYVQYQLLNRPKMSFIRWRSNLRERINSQLAKSLSRSTYALVCTLLLGKKPPSDTYTSMRSICSCWGIVHYLARSGLHVVLIIWAWTLLLGLLPIHFYVKQVILLMLIGLFHLLTWPSISFMRALITFLLYKINILSGRNSQPLHILSLTTLIILIHNPLQLFFLDFQLSFGLTCALAWFNEHKIQVNRFYN